MAASNEMIRMVASGTSLQEARKEESPIGAAGSHHETSAQQLLASDDNDIANVSSICATGSSDRNQCVFRCVQKLSLHTFSNVWLHMAGNLDKNFIWKSPQHMA